MRTDFCGYCYRRLVHSTASCSEYTFATDARPVCLRDVVGFWSREQLPLTSSSCRSLRSLDESDEGYSGLVRYGSGYTR